ncbi:MAG: alpha-amylase family glycosyl hydrolase [Thermodesulfobacteriota bacterium]
MGTWPKNPLIYEINTWVWLAELSRKASRPITLASVPEAEWDRIAAMGFDAVWLMGVWERSPRGIEISMDNDSLLADFRRALPDFTEPDNVGSPYCIRSYSVAPHLGGPAGLAEARWRLSRRDLLLILDFVPNHAAPDHPWVERHPDFFIQGNKDHLRQDPDSFLKIDGTVFACGRDPFFPAWPDVLQLNAFHDGLRSAMKATLMEIGHQCDGVRCDMAMLPMNAVFEKTWGFLTGPPPAEEYWPPIISGVKDRYPDFRFIAEAYWDLEWELQQQGFDYCYDKRLYDRLEHGPAESVRLHLCADTPYQEKLVRFIENHDEPRAADAFAPLKQRALAVTALTLPGARLVHEGQLEGRRVRLPVFLARRPEETPVPETVAFYHRLLGFLQGDVFQRGVWRLCGCTGWPDNPSCGNLVAWSWAHGATRRLLVVNLSAMPSQALVLIPWDDLRGGHWRFEDVFTSSVYERNGDELADQGLFVDLPAWGFHVLAGSR